MYHVVVSPPLPSAVAAATSTLTPASTAASSRLLSTDSRALSSEGELSVCRVEAGCVHLFRRVFDEPTGGASAVPSSSAANAVCVLLLAVPASVTVARILSALCSTDAALLLSSLRSCVRLCDPHSGQHSVLLEWADGAVASLFCRCVDGRPLPLPLPQPLPQPLSSQPSLDSERGPDRCLAFPLCDRPTRSTAASSSSVLAARSGFAEIPRCPRCLLRLDTSCSGIVAAFSVSGSGDGRRERDRRDNHEGANASEPQQPQQPATQGSLAHNSGGSTLKAASQDGSLSGCWVEVRCGVCDKLDQSAVAAAAAVSSLSSIQCCECSAVGVEREAIWLCLICAHVGCGRNLSGHAAVHFERTGHRYCIELLQHYVWDYHADGFVHRVHGRDTASTAPANTVSSAAHAGQRQLSESEPSADSSRFARGEYDSDTEVVEADDTEWLNTDDEREGQSHSPADDGDNDDGLLDGKLASITSHYSHLLGSELSKQADFFEQLIADKRSTLDSGTAQHTTQLVSVQQSVAGLQAEIDVVQQAVRQCRVLLAERRRRNAAQHDENTFVKQINASLLSDQLAQQRQPQPSGTSGSSSSGSGVASSQRTQSTLAAKQRRISGLQADITRTMQQLDAAHGSGKQHANR